MIINCLKGDVMILENFSFKFKNKTIFKEVNISFQLNNIYYLLGPNGQGKSTLLKLLTNRYYKYEGMLTSFEKSISYLADKTYLYEHLSGQEYLKFIKDIFYLKTTDEEVDKILSGLNLKKYINEEIANYSHGMRRKLEIATIFFRDTDIILLDEPFSGIDKESLEFITRKLSEQKSEKIIIFTSHQEDISRKLATKIIQIKDYKLIEKL